MTAWNFITNYGAVLGVVARHPQITAREIAAQLGITERTVLRIIAALESGGYLQKFRESRVNTYEVNHGQPLRGAQDRDVEVGELLKLLASASGDNDQNGEEQYEEPGHCHGSPGTGGPGSP